jgi:hypothetical protein
MGAPKQKSKVKLNSGVVVVLYPKRGSQVQMLKSAVVAVAVWDFAAKRAPKQKLKAELNSGAMVAVVVYPKEGPRARLMWKDIVLMSSRMTPLKIYHRHGKYPIPLVLCCYA